MVYDHGIPNLVRVDSNHWRSGQPTTPEAWSYLYMIGVRVVIKLNDDSEGSDDVATDAGLSVVKFPIPPFDGKNPFDGPSCAQLDQIQDAIYLYGPHVVLWHCSHGQDRSGLVAFHDCTHRRKLSPAVCEKEMMDNHFHPALLGLRRAREECP